MFLLFKMLLFGMKCSLQFHEIVLKPSETVDLCVYSCLHLFVTCYSIMGLRGLHNLGNKLYIQTIN